MDTVAGVLTVAAQRFKAKPLVITPDRTVTFAELDALADDVCRRLCAQGVNPGDRVTLWLENGWRWMVYYFALAKLGAVVSPCNVVLTPAEVLYICNDCKASTVITSEAQAAALVAAATPELAVPRVLDSRLAEQSGGEPIVTPRDPGVRTQEVTPESVWTIGYTSGTTGRPKGALLRHRSIALNAALTALMHGRNDRDVVVSALPCTHVYGNIVMNCAVMQGMTLVLLPRFDETAILRSIQAHRATIFDGVPAMYLKLLNAEQLDQFDLSSLRLCTVGGQTMPVSKMEEVEDRFGCPLVELWGMTELGGLGTTHPHTCPRRAGSIGIALPMMEAKVAPLPTSPGGVGELMIRGPLVMDGYLGDAQATAQTIEPDGWMHTGDLVRQDSDGYFYVVDRVKEVIVSGGYNVYPAEIERVIALHPAVAMVAVAPMFDEVKGQVPKAFIVWKEGASCTPAEIIAHCRQQLASYKIPRAVESMQDLPRNSTGKVLRRALAATAI